MWRHNGVIMNDYGVTGQGQNHTVNSLNPLMSEQLVRLPLRIPASLKQKLLELAEREHRSLNKQIEFLLEQCLRERNSHETDELEPPRGHRKRK
jgi:hypothetical protein